MANVTLHRDELVEGELPPFCMRCGEPAALVKQKKFSWGPGWVMILLGAGALCSGPLFLVALILVPFLLKQMRVPVPLCDRHRNHWLPLQIVLFGGIAVVALTFFLAVILFVTAEGPGDRKTDLAGLFCVGTFAALLIMLFPAAILQTTVIRPTEITSDRITLRSVAKEFAEALKKKRRGPSEMVLIVVCSACAAQLRIPFELSGRRVKCRDCGNVFSAPEVLPSVLEVPGESPDNADS